MNYDNFNIRIRKEHDNRYSVYVWGSFGSTEQYLSDDILSEEMRDKFACFDENKCSREELIEVGTQLFNSLFHGTVLNRFNTSLGNVENDESKGLRIRLIIEAPRIAELPWELLYDPDRKLFLATWNKTPITRYLAISQGNRQLTITPPLRVLIAIPSFTGLDVDKEEKIVRTAFAELEKKKLVQLEFMKGNVGIDSIDKRLIEGPPFHIFHFIGHGCFKKGEEEGYLLMNPDAVSEDSAAASGLSKQIASEWLCGEDFANLFLDDALFWLSAEKFAELFKNHFSMKLIVLNSCQGAKVSSTRPLGGVVPRLFGREIPAVVAMQYPISDVAALRFATDFYHSLCRGYERGLIDVAITNTRNSMRMKVDDDLSFATPVLFMRSDSGAIFDLKEKELEPIAVPSVTVGPDLILTDYINIPGLVSLLVYRLWRRIIDPLVLVSDAPRLQVLRDTRHETLNALTEKKLQEQKEEELAKLEKDIEDEHQELAQIDKRLSGVVGAAITVIVTALFLSSIVFVVSVYGFFDRVSSNFIRSGLPFADDQVRIIVVDTAIIVDPNIQTNGFPNKDTINDRAYHAELIDALARAGARVVALDIFPKGPSPMWDAKLAKSIKQAAERGTQVIVGTVGFTATGEPATEIPEPWREPLKDNLGNVAVAYTRFRPAIQWVKLGDEISEGPRREVSDQGVSIAPSFVLQAIRQFKRSENNQPPNAFFNQNDNTIRLLNNNRDLVFAIPVDGKDMLYYFSVPDDNVLEAARSSYQDIYQKRSNSDALSGFRGKIVMIGYKREGDTHYVGGGRYIPGVEIQACVISNILQEVHLKKLSGIYEFLAILLMVALGLVLQTKWLRRFSITLPFKSRVLRRIIPFPLPLIVITLLYLTVIYFVYSRTLWVVDITPHLAALFLSYWIAALLRESYYARTRPEIVPPQKEVMEHA